MGDRLAAAGSVLTTVYLGLGSNVGDREEMIRMAVAELRARGIAVRRLSPIYESEPQGTIEQRWFLNAVAEAETELTAKQLLSSLQAVEENLGRRRTVRNGPRTIDLDILLFGNLVMRTAELEVPHARYRERRFVLAPIADLVPGLRDPVTGESVSEMLEQLAGQKVRRLD